MRPTAYFTNSEAMADHAKAWRQSGPYRWYLRTTLRCDHVHHEKRKAIVLVERERLVQKLITCKTCTRRDLKQAVKLVKERLTLKDFIYEH